MSGSRVLGIIQPLGSNVSNIESPAGKSVGLKKIGCLGRITSYQELDNDKYAIVLSGITRFDVEAEVVSTKPYRIVDVSYQRFTVISREGSEKRASIANGSSQRSAPTSSATT